MFVGFEQNGLGNYIKIEIHSGYVEVYGHLQDNSIPWHVGDMLAMGAVVGHLGQTGNAAGQDVSNAHVHFEVRQNGQKTNPVDFLTTPCPWD